MIKYKKLGFKSLEEYTEHFFVTLLPSNKTYEYLVDWNKVKKGIHKYLWRGTCLVFLLRSPNSEYFPYDIINKKW